MDKAVPQLDPKLKEAYDRVMGTVVTPSKPAEPQPQVSPPPPPAHSEPIQPVSPPPAQPTLEHLSQHPSSSATMVPSPTAEKAAVVKTKRKVSPLIIGLGVIVFLAIYAVVWIKYFGLTIPFLNPGAAPQ
ncbi:MAG: hypothetical protein A2W22_01255 [Candidatus Levybacteria bacterium RBG_16_35_11]|nr:MAG: hypothetical protein A2W22_01255 [Candidatus Levybacteria bacterium RBG_16_35_11]